MKEIIDFIVGIYGKYADFRCKIGRHYYTRQNNMLLTGGTCTGKSIVCSNCGKIF